MWWKSLISLMDDRLLDWLVISWYKFNLIIQQWLKKTIILTNSYVTPYFGIQSSLD
jgi:hypothetical protein